jgi:hypothetical protein
MFGQIVKHTGMAKELNIAQILDKIQSYKRNWVQHVNRMPLKTLPRTGKT